MLKIAGMEADVTLAPRGALGPVADFVSITLRNKVWKFIDAECMVGG